MRILALALALSLAPAPAKVTAIRDATVVVGPLLTIPNGTVVLRDGLIESVGPDPTVPAGAEVIDGKGLVVYAGFIDARTRLGLPDTKRPPEAQKLAEGEKPDFMREAPPFMEQANRKGLRPELDAAELVALSEADLKAAHRAGFAVAVTAAGDEYLSGRAVAVTLSGAARRNALLKAKVGLHASFRTYGTGYPGTTMGAIAHLRQTFLDAQHYARVWAAHQPGRPRPAIDPALEALQPVLRGELPVFFEADGEREILRAIALSEEFGFKLTVVGGAEAYRLAPTLRGKGIPVVLGLRLPKDPPKKADEDEPEKLKRERERLREEQTRCAFALFQARVPFCFSSASVPAGDVLGNLQKLVERGLPADAALAALTTSPARLLGLSATHGTLQRGKAANLTVLTAPIGDKKARVRYVFADGAKFEYDPKKPAGGKPEIEIAGKYRFTARAPQGPFEGTLEIKQSGADLEGTISTPAGDAPIRGTVDGKSFEFSFTQRIQERSVEFSVKGEKKGEGLAGNVTGPLGEAEWTAAPEEEQAIGFAGQDTLSDGDVEIDADRVPKTKTGGNVLIRNATILTVSDAGTIEGGSILVRDGKIASVGRTVPESGGATVIDAKGLYVIPGIIDCHSHIANEGGLNEFTQSVSPEVRVRDVLDPRDVAIWRASAGGVTAANILHGSANAIGGQNAVIKLRTGRAPADLLFHDAPRGVKFALGENPKQSNFTQNRGKRFPNTRMGVEAVFRRAFTEARAYEKSLREDPLARRDLRLEALLQILKGEILVHCHCYRADEILMILQVAKDFGFRVASLQHVLEGYRVAPEIAAAGAGASTFSDWWSYKIEAYEAIPHNAALMTQAGVCVSVNSDSHEQIRHLNVEAAKAVKYGGLSEREALALVTLNPARQLGVDRFAGSIEVGKDADLAVYNGHPLSSYSRCVMTFVEGEVAFEDREAPSRATGEFRLEKRPRRAPAPLPEGEAFAIANARIHPVTAAPFHGTIVIRNGKIAALGPGVSAPPDATQVDGTGLSVYPGMIDASTNVGLTEIGSVAGTRDEGEIGGLQPDLRAIAAVNPHSELVAVTRANGITAVLAAPGDGLIAGQSAVIRLDGWTPREMAVEEVFALHVAFPSRPRGEEARPEDDKPLKELRGIFEAAKRHDGKERDLRLEALKPYARGERPVVFHADAAADIRGALKFAEELGLRPVISGGREAWKTASLLARKKVPVILAGVMAMPARDHDPYWAAFSNAARLSAAGVKFAISADEKFSGNSRNTPYHAAWAAAYGLDRDEALKAVTIYPAEILGVADRIGSLEVGKSADLIVTTGDPLEVVTDVVYVFIAGRPVSLESKHTRSYDKFRARIEPPQRRNR